MWEYCVFYESIEKVRDHFVLAAFEEVTGDLPAVIRRLNSRFDTNFRVFEHTPENVSRIFAEMEAKANLSEGSVNELKIARPSDLRKELKERLRSELHTPRRRALVDRAEDIYHRLTGCQ